MEQGNVVTLNSFRTTPSRGEDWIAFASALRSLAALDEMPPAVLDGVLYGFESWPGHFTAEQALALVERTAAELRVKLENHRASQATLEG